MHANISQDELQEATAATLRAHATSKEAEALVADIASRVAENELATGTRQNRRRDTAGDLVYAVGAFVADLLKPLGSERPHEWVYRSMHAKSFTAKKVKYRTFASIVEQLDELGFLDRAEVSQHVDGPGEVGRYAARFRATPKLLRLCERHGVAPMKALDHFEYEYDLPKEPLELRAKKEESFDGGDAKPSGKLLEFERFFYTDIMETDLRDLNEFFAKQTLRGGTHQGYIRIFNNGDDPHFRWNMGGRLYSQYFADSYQILSYEKRAEMTINGEPVAEIDIRASYLTIFLAWHGTQLRLTEDPYVLEDFGEAGRPAVKAWMVATFGNNKPARRWPPKMLGKQPELSRYKASDIGKAALRQYPVLAAWGVEPYRGHIPTWADLMCQESDIMVQTMLRLMREFAVPSLTVHDSLIVPASNAELAAEQLAKWFENRTQAKPILIINQKGHERRKWIPENTREKEAGER